MKIKKRHRLKITEEIILFQTCSNKKSSHPLFDWSVWYDRKNSISLIFFFIIIYVFIRLFYLC